MNIFKLVKHHKKRFKNKYFPKRAGDYVFTFERFCDKFQGEHFERHFNIYRFASQFTRSATVLDVGCGCGYGNGVFIDAGADRVVGIDHSRQAIKYANERFVSPKSIFMVMDACGMAFRDRAFDVVVSVENIEHVRDHLSNLREIRRVLKPGGMLVLQTPNKEMTSPGKDKPDNEFHFKEFYFEELEPLLRKHFRDVLIFENADKAKEEAGIIRRQARIKSGNTGVFPEEARGVKFMGRDVDLTHLNNAVSFLCLCR